MRVWAVECIVSPAVAVHPKDLKSVHPLPQSVHLRVVSVPSVVNFAFECSSYKIVARLACRRPPARVDNLSVER
jgi:hypothetical protein